MSSRATTGVSVNDIAGGARHPADPGEGCRGDQELVVAKLGSVFKLLAPVALDEVKVPLERRKAAQKRA